MSKVMTLAPQTKLIAAANGRRTLQFLLSHPGGGQTSVDAALVFPDAETEAEFLDLWRRIFAAKPKRGRRVGGSLPGSRRRGPKRK